MPTAEIRVWDPFVRLSHWLLAAAVIWTWLSHDPLWLHSWLGYLAAVLVVLRVLWGFLGPTHARFVSFLTGPRSVFDYLAGLVRFSSKRYLGHSPAGGAMIVALLVMIATTAGTGMATLAAAEGQGPLSSVITKVVRPPQEPGHQRPPLPIREVHQVLANVTIALVVLHVVGVVLASFAHHENLARSMITGRKRAEIIRADAEPPALDVKSLPVSAERPSRGGLHQAVKSVSHVGDRGGDVTSPIHPHGPAARGRPEDGPEGFPQA
jgi:cytochrome b